jgi:hypothetical protein
MRAGYDKNVRRGLQRAMGIGVVGMLAGAMTLAPLAAAGNVREEERITNDRTINRAEVENLHAGFPRDTRIGAKMRGWWPPKNCGGSRRNIRVTDSN